MNHFSPRNWRNSKRKRQLAKMANMRAAKARKRLEHPAEVMPKLEKWFRLELGVRDKTTGEVAWTDLRSVRDAAKRLAVVIKYCS